MDSRQIPLSDPPGFTRYRREFDDGKNYQVIELLVPTLLAEQLARIREERHAEQVRAAEERRTQLRRNEASGLSAKPPSQGGAEQTEPVFDGAVVRNGVVEVPEPEPGRGFARIFSLSDLATRLHSLKASPAGGRLTGANKERDRDVFLRMAKLGALRPVAQPSNWAARLGKLQRTQPHFQPVVDFLRGRFAIADASRGTPFIPPILLVGEPGVGKTHFCFELAAALGMQVHRHSLDGADTSAALVGSHKSWSGNTIGLVFEAVCLGKIANPLIVLDELDKAAGHRHGNPLGPLHSLLEWVSSSNVRDLAIDFEFDASHVSWIATANNRRDIPAPLVSRFEVFEIERPTADQCVVLARAVADKVVGETKAGIRRPSAQIIHAIANMTPREIGKALRTAIGHALLHGRRTLRLSDVPVDVGHQTDARPFGFGTRHPSGA